MPSALDKLLATTFASPEAAAAALDASKGDLPKARKALARKKSTPLSPKLGPRIEALVARAKAAGAHPQARSNGMDFLAFGLPPDVAVVLFAALHWKLSEVDLAGACLHGAGTMTSEPHHAGGSEMPLHIGTLASGEDVVFRYFAKGSKLVGVTKKGATRNLAGLDAVLGEIEKDALKRGLPSPFGEAPAPAKRRRAPGPPVAKRGEDHRVYAGSELIDVELPEARLYSEPRLVVVRLKKKMKLPEDDLWLVSREGKLFKLAPGKLSRGSVACFATPH